MQFKITGNTYVNIIIDLSVAFLKRPGDISSMLSITVRIYVLFYFLGDFY